MESTSSTWRRHILEIAVIVQPTVAASVVFNVGLHSITFIKNMQGLTLTRLSTCPSDQVTVNAYWLLSLFKPVSKYTAPLRQRKALYLTHFQRCLKLTRLVLFVGSNHSHIVDYKWSGHSIYWSNSPYTAWRCVGSLSCWKANDSGTKRKPEKHRCRMCLEFKINQTGSPAKHQYTLSSMLHGGNHTEIIRSPTLRLTKTRRLEPKISNLDSSDQMTNFHRPNVHCSCFLAQPSLFLLVSSCSGFFAAIRPWRPDSRSLLWTVDVEMCLLLELCEAFIWYTLSEAGNCNELILCSRGNSGSFLWRSSWEPVSF
jgi:hypothetical protein